MSGYNGHRNRHHWNVALWISNDFGTYRAAQELLRANASVGNATTQFLKWAAQAYPKGETPDGYAFTPATVRAALAQLRRDEPELRPNRRT